MKVFCHESLELHGTYIFTLIEQSAMLELLAVLHKARVFLMTFSAACSKVR